ncbi:MAG: protoporphyrinogen oxidase [Acidimicrobiales bacterium]
MGRSSVVIVGGGISGLAAAWELTGAEAGPTDSTPRVELIEASSRCGGSLATITFAGRTIDLGADGFLARRPEAVELALELGLEAQMEAIAESGAWLYSRGRLHELPPGLVLGVPTSLETVRRFQGVGWRARAGAARDTFMPATLRVAEDITIGEITRKKLGRELTYQFIEPMIGGIQAGRIDDLSAQSVFPALFAAAQAGGSLMRALRPVPSTSAPTTPLFYSLVDGVGSLPTQLVRQLKERGVVVRTNVAVTAVRRTPAASYPLEVDTASTTTPANGVILAVPAPVAGAFIGSFDADLEPLGSIDSASAGIVTFSVPRDAVTLPTRGTGVLVPLHTPWSGTGSLMVTALTFLDRKWPHLYRSEDVLLRAHVGRSDDTRWSELSDEELTTRLNDELTVLLPKWATPSASLVQRWPDGLPQYRTGHGRLVERARSVGLKHHVVLAGNAYDGVGVPASIGSGRRAASELASRF